MTSMLDKVRDLVRKDNGVRDYRPVYVPEGDCIVYYVDDRPCHAVRLDSLVTVYVSDEQPDSIVGLEIKSVLKRLRAFGDYGVYLVGRNVDLGFLFMCAGVKPEFSPLARGLFSKDIAQQQVELQPS